MIVFLDLWPHLLPPYLLCSNYTSFLAVSQIYYASYLILLQCCSLYLEHSCSGSLHDLLHFIQCFKILPPRIFPDLSKNSSSLLSPSPALLSVSSQGLSGFICYPCTLLYSCSTIAYQGLFAIPVLCYILLQLLHYFCLHTLLIVIIIFIIWLCTLPELKFQDRDCCLYCFTAASLMPHSIHSIN